MSTVTLRDESRYLKTLQKAANHNSYGNYRMVAGVWRGSTFLGWGVNLYRDRRGGETIHPMYAGKGLHAELDALSSYDCRRATLYIAGLSKTGYEVTSKPCTRCTILIRNSTLSYVVYFDGKDTIKIPAKEL